MRALTLLLLLAPLALAETPPPPNDHRANAEPLDVLLRTHTARTATHGAGIEDDEPRPCGIGATVWYKLDLHGGALGHVRIDTRGSDYSTAIAVYRAHDDTLEFVTCSEHAPGLGRDAEVLFTALPGATYLVQAGGYNGGVGTLHLTVRGGTPALPETPP